MIFLFQVENSNVFLNTPIRHSLILLSAVFYIPSCWGNYDVNLFEYLHEMVHHPSPVNSENVRKYNHPLMHKIKDSNSQSKIIKEF